MPREIVVLGSTMIDFTTHSHRLPRPGETIIGKEFNQSFGGKGANQCVSAARLGASTALITSLGSDVFAKQYLDRLKEEKVDITYVKLRKESHSGAAQIIVADNGENSIVIVPGSNELLSTDDVGEAADVIKNASVLLCQFETPLKVTLHALRIKKNHGISIVNGAPAISNIDPDILEFADIFCVNETEAECITGMNNLSILNYQEAINKLLIMGCNTIIITLGSAGAIFASKENPQLTFVPTDQVQPVDTTGAGDAFLGALAYYIAYHPHLKLEESIRRSCRIATQSILKTGTQTSFPYRNQLSQDLLL